MSSPCIFVDIIDCPAATEIIVAASVSKISARQFQTYTNLRHITFGADSLCTTFSEYAFASISNLESIQLPAELLTIEQYCFYLCKSLETISFPSQLNTIAYRAFYGCTGLNSLSWPESGSITIQRHAFDSFGMTSFHITASISLLEGAVTPSSSFAEYSCDDNHPQYYAKDGVLFTHDKQTLLLYPPGKNRGIEYVVPNSVQAIGSYAFQFSSSNIKFESGTLIESFASYSFDNWYGTSITYPDDCLLSTIGGHSFSGASAIEEFHVVPQMKSLTTTSFFRSSIVRFTVAPGVTAYYEDNGILTTDQYTIALVPPALTEYTVPAYITGIASGAFSYSSITTVFFQRPSQLTTMGSGAFTHSLLSEIDFDPDCPLKSFSTWAFRSTSLTSITLPNNLKTIDGRAFTSSLFTTFVVPDDHPHFKQHDGVLYTLDMTEVVRYPPGKNDSEYTFPQSITRTNLYSFYGCTKLTSVQFPIGSPFTIFGQGTFSSVTQLNIECANAPHLTTIGTSCFTGNTVINSLVFPDSVTTIGQSAFSSMPNLRRVKFSASLAAIQQKAFDGCKALHVIEFDRYCPLMSIPDKCFAGANPVAIQIPWKLQSIVNGAFEDSIISLHFISKPREKVLQAFINNYKLEYLYVPCECANWTYITPLVSSPQIIVECSTVYTRLIWRNLIHLSIQLLIDHL